MDHAALEIFCAVAAELSITRAAKRLGRVQSNVTTRIQQLEQELGVALFRRDANRLALSDDGTRFLDYAKRLLALADEARQVLKPHAPSGLLRVGSMESTAAIGLPGPLAAFNAAYPTVQLRLSTAPSRQLLEQVRSGMTDCAFAALPECAAFAKARNDDPVGQDSDTCGLNARMAADLESIGLEGIPVFEEALLLVLPPGHAPVTQATDIGVKSLAAFTQGCAYRSVVEDWMGTDGPALTIQEVGSYHTMLACVAAGACASVVPKRLLALLRDPPEYRTLPIATVPTWLVWRKGFHTATFSAFKLVFPSLATTPAV